MLADTGIAPVGAELVAVIGGMFIPWLINLIKQTGWTETVRVVFAYVATALWTFLSFYLTEQFVFEEPFELREVIMMTFAVFFVAHAAFKVYWKTHESNMLQSGRYK